MAQSQTVLDAQNVKFAIGGRPIESGFGEGTYISISRVSPRFESTAGADGTVAFARTRDERHTITLSLMYGHGSAKILDDLFDSDANAVNGAGVGAVQIIDLNTRQLWYAGVARITNKGDISLTQAAVENVDYEITTCDLRKEALP